MFDFEELKKKALEMNYKLVKIGEKKEKQENVKDFSFVARRENGDLELIKNDDPKHLKEMKKGNYVFTSKKNQIKVLLDLDLIVNSGDDDSENEDDAESESEPTPPPEKKKRGKK